MRPDTSRTLQGVAINLLTSVMAETKTAFGQQTVGIAATLAMWVAEEAERGADRLVLENRATRAILGDGLELAGSEAEAVRAAIATPVAPDFKISSLQAENDSLRRGLIALHTAVESKGSPAAEAMNERIWAELIESTRRRQFQVRIG